MPENKPEKITKYISVESCSVCISGTCSNGVCLDERMKPNTSIVEHICNDTIHPDCPLPDAHDLISRDAVIREIENYGFKAELIDKINSMPSVRKVSE